MYNTGLLKEHGQKLLNILLYCECYISAVLASHSLADHLSFEGYGSQSKNGSSIRDRSKCLHERQASYRGCK